MLKISICNSTWFNPCSSRWHGEGNGHPTPVLLPGNPVDGGVWWVGCSPCGRWESDTTEWLPFHFSLSCIGEGNGNPLQCSCLENPRDWGAWWAAVYGVAQSRTRLKWLTSSSSSLYEVEKKRKPTPVLLLGKSHGQRSLVGCSPWGCKYDLATKQPTSSACMKTRNSSHQQELEVRGKFSLVHASISKQKCVKEAKNCKDRCKIYY